MKKIVLIIPYLGNWPMWFDAYLVSISKNPTIDWLFITDCTIPENYPENVRFISVTLEKLNRRINDTLGVVVPLTGRKLCDLRPAFGHIFKEEIKDYEFWGYCDVDIIWGNIRSFITEEILGYFDIISSRKGNTSGHFTLFRNEKKVNTLFYSLPGWEVNLKKKKNQRMDEEGLSAYLKLVMQNSIHFDIKVKWDRILCNSEKGRDSHQEYYLDRWQWKDGKMLELINGNPVNEVMYLHFINWKRTMRYSEVTYKDQPHQFYISYNGMHFDRHSRLYNLWNTFKNLFDGYYRREYKRIKKRKIKSVLKRIKIKVNSI